MAKHKTTTPSMVSEPAAEYIRTPRKAARPAWRFKRLSQQELMAQARKPMPMPALKRKVEENPTAEAAYAELLDTTPAGFKALLRGSKSLVPAQAERVLLYDQAMARGVEVFGSEAKFERWLGVRIPKLDNKRPADLMTTASGLMMVLDELEAISYGTYA